jgi:hypothetical protein
LMDQISQQPPVVEEPAGSGETLQPGQ